MKNIMLMMIAFSLAPGAQRLEARRAQEPRDGAGLEPQRQLDFLGIAGLGHRTSAAAGVAAGVLARSEPARARAVGAESRWSPRRNTNEATDNRLVSKT